MDEIMASAAQAVADVPDSEHRGRRLSAVRHPVGAHADLLEQAAKGLTVVSKHRGVDGAGLGVLGAPVPDRPRVRQSHRR